MKFMKWKYFFFVFAFLLSSLTLHANGLDFTKPLLKKVELEGSVNVIVTIKPSATFTSILSTHFLPDHERLQIVSKIRNSVLNQLSATDYSNLQRFDFVPQFAITVNKKALEQLLADENLEVSENMMYFPSLQQSVPRIFPNHLSSPYTGNNEWAVAIIDTGVDKNHSFLATGISKKVLSEACYSGGFHHPVVSSVCPGGVKSSTASGSGAPCSQNIDSKCAHGTHVAGIATGDGNSFDGVARLGKLIAVQVASKITDSGLCDGAPTCIGAFCADILAGLNRVYALRNTYKIASVNISLGGGQFSGHCDNDPLKPIIDLLRNAKIATVIATGNHGSDSEISSPACISSTIAVGSTLDTADIRSPFSNNSTALDLYAPGSSITSSVPGGGFATKDGTSMAAPHVAGAWAILKHAASGATVSELETILKSNGPMVTSYGVSRRRIDIQSAIRELVGAPIMTSIMAPIYYLLLRTSLSKPSLLNGDFENGPVSWTESSSNGYDIIGEWGLARSGTWSSWLGGEVNEISSVQQQVTVPSTSPYLCFYHQIYSEDVCGWDYGYVRINGTTVTTVSLCSNNNTAGWEKISLDLSAYTGQTIMLQIEGNSDETDHSSWFIDDVSFQASANVGATLEMESVSLKIDSAS